MHTILGATGNIGSKLTQHLLAKGQQVKAIGRSMQKMQKLIEQGAQPIVGDAANLAFLSEAFEGAETVFAMIPSNFTAVDFRAYQNEFGRNIRQAITNANVTHVVNLSSHGAHLDKKTGPILGLRDQEQRLNALENVNILHLRPTFFMENFLMDIELIKNMGFNGGHIKDDLPIAMIATQDIAQVAAEHMLARNFSGKSVRELLGPRDISMAEATRILGEKIDKPDLKYIYFSKTDYISGLTEAGLTDDFANLMAEMGAGLSDGLFGSSQKRAPENVTPTGIEAFAEYFSEVYNS